MVKAARGHIRRSALVASVAAVLAVAVAFSWISQADAVDAPSDIENGFVIEVNNQRTLAGLAPLAVNDDLIIAAREWTDSMLNDQVLAHATDITTGVPPGWTKAGENVGRGDSVDGLMIAFMKSPGHRRNVLDPEFTHIGVGSFIDPAGVLYTTHRFVQAPIVQEVATSLDTSLVSSCQRGHGDVRLKITNNDNNGRSITATIGVAAEQLLVIEPAGQGEFSSGFQPDGAIRVTAAVDGAVFFDETVDVSCGATIGAGAELSS